MHLPTVTLSIDQSNHAPRFLNFQQTKTIIDSDDGFRTGCRKVSRQQQPFSGLQSPR